MIGAARAGALLAALATCALVGLGGGQGGTDTRRFEPLEPWIAYTDPDLAVTAGGEVWATFLAFDGASEVVLVAGVEPRVEVAALSAGAGTRFPPRAAATRDGGLAVAWCELRDGRHDVVLRARDAEGSWGPLEAVTAHAAADAAPALAAAADSLWITWVSARDGQYEVYARERAADGWRAPLRVTDHPASDVEPSLAVDGEGVPWVAWSSWRDGSYADGNYEVYVRRLDGESAPRRVSTAPDVDTGPSLVALPSGLALAWTGARFERDELGGLTALAYDGWTDKRLRVARLSGGEWSEPLDVRRRYPGARSVHVGDRCVAAPGPDGEVWVLHHEFVDGGVRGKGLRELRLARVGPEGSGPPLDLSLRRAAAPGGPRAVWAGARLWVAEGTPGGEDAAPAVRVVSWSRAALEGAGPPRASSARRLPPPDDEGASEGRVADLARGPDERHVVARNARSWRAWYGNLHLHSSDSRDGAKEDGPPERNLQAVLDVAALDFACVTDHSGPGLRPHAWRAQVRLAQLWNRPGHFVVFPGYEWSSPSFGHKNVIFPDQAAASASEPLPSLRRSPNDLWEALGELPALTIPHHTSHGNVGPTDWSFRDDERQRLVEIFQKRGNYEHDGAPLQKASIGTWQFFPGHGVRDALAAGHRLGIIASPDHGGGFGLAGAWSPELTRAGVYEALHARRTFGTTGAKMSLWMDVEGEPLGSRLERGLGPVPVSVEVRGTVAGLRLVLVVDGEELLEHASEADAVEHTFVLEPRGAGEVYLYLRAEQSDGHIGWTSPIWLMLG